MLGFVLSFVCCLFVSNGPELNAMTVLVFVFSINICSHFRFLSHSFVVMTTVYEQWLSGFGVPLMRSL